MKVVLAGGTGLVGQSVLSLLIDRNEISEIILITRNTWKGELPKVTNLVTSFETLEEISGDIFICCLGTTIKKAKSKEAFRKVDYDYVCKIAEIAEKVGAKKFLVVSAMGADINSKFFYNQVKGEMEKFVLERNIPSVVVFRPSLLIGERKESRLLEDISQKIAPVLDFVLPKKYRSIKASDVALAIVDHACSNKEGKIIVESDQMNERTKKDT